jgi:hypothetical protein
MIGKQKRSEGDGEDQAEILGTVGHQHLELGIVPHLTRSRQASRAAATKHAS